jgi:hypothetical protein
MKSSSRLFDISFNRLRRWRSVVILIKVLFFLLIIDRVCSLFVEGDIQVQSLALPPSETIQYKARDFQFTVTTNRLGFRGPEISITKPSNKKRILVLGNSFTYGWGLDYELTWPYLLEGELSSLGVPTETVNLATPGTTARMMTEIATRSIPLLKPDIVIISVLQGGSLFALQHDTHDTIANTEVNRERPEGVRNKVLIGLSYALPNFTHLLENIRQQLAGATFKPSSAISKEWRKEAEAFMLNMSEDQRKRYDSLNSESKERFVSGTFNVSMITASINNPNRFVETVKSAEIINNGVTGMQDLFTNVKALSDANGARTFVVSMPYGAYLGGEASENLKRLGFNIPVILEKDRSTENRIRLAADNAGLEFISVLDEFHFTNTNDLFIPFDGHYNASGSKFFAHSLANKLLRSQQTIRN